MIKDAGSEFDDYSISHKIIAFGLWINWKRFFDDLILDNNLHDYWIWFLQKKKTLAALIFAKNGFCFYSV